MSSNLKKSISCFFLYFLSNRIIAYIPSFHIRKLYYTCVGMKLGKKTNIDMGQYIMGINNLTIGDHSYINQSCILDARGGLYIGNSVSISHRVSIITGSHDLNSPSFEGMFKPIYIGDYAWIGINVTILQGITIGEGAVVCAGAVVTKDVEPYSVVAGIPATKITNRNRELNYKCSDWKIIKTSTFI